MWHPPSILVPLSLSLLVQAGNISWASPAVGDVYGPGDTIIAKWTADSSIASPSFRLCESNTTVLVNGTTSCGSSVSPLVQQSAGSYFISLSTPNVTDEAGFYLQMVDDLGNITSSPEFSLSPTLVSANTTSSPVNGTIQLTPTVSPDLSMNHVPPPTAAFAIPLSFVGVILLGSFFLCLHHRRKLKEERALDGEKLSSVKEKKMLSTATSHPPSLVYLSRSSSFTSLKRMYSSKESHGDIFTPVYKRSPELLDRSYSSTRREGEPRQPTRQPFHIPTALVTTPTIRSKHSSHSKTSFSIPSSRSTRVPASLFKAAHRSPVVPYPPPGLEESDMEEKATNASVNHFVISNYLAPSPIPPSLSPGLPAKLDRLHVRTEAVSSLSDLEKPLPSSPRAPYSEETVYKVVAGVIKTGSTI